tara:strand:- start:62878 stop:63558 length:681 start_codon:yes stop_codon:yes gene_type:complete
MPIDLIPVSLALILTIVHLFSKTISEAIKKFHIEITSFSAGILITIIILSLLPEAIKGAEFINVFLLMLIGFTIFHIAEKYLYQHIKNKKELMKDLAELHIAGFYIDHFVIGLIIFLVFSLQGKLGFLIFLPFLLHTVSSSFSLEHCDKYSKKSFNKIILASSTVTGAIVANLVVINTTLFFGILAFSIGAMLYIVIRDMLPKGRVGSILYYIIGVMLTLVILLTQ